jgi:hypothetical protein
MSINKSIKSATGTTGVFSLEQNINWWNSLTLLGG